MITHLHGVLIEKYPTEAVIECMGVGYLVNISLNTFEELPELGTELRVKTHFIPREDGHHLYGFISNQERTVFKMFISISGIGPKIALGILSAVSIEELQEFILSSNTKALVKLPGIGKKTAERLVLELKDKFEKHNLMPSGSADSKSYLIKEEALAALISLGYNKTVAERSIKKVLSEKNDNINTEELIKLGLKYAMS